jgi:hypothetical protein
MAASMQRPPKTYDGSCEPMPWVERDEPWYQTEVEYCQVTGQLLPRRYWTFEVNGNVVKTCHPRYERLYHEHLARREARER